MPDSASERIAKARRARRDAQGATASERIAVARQAKRAASEPNSVWGNLLGGLEAAGIDTKPQTLRNFEGTAGADQARRSAAVERVTDADAQRRINFERTQAVLDGKPDILLEAFQHPQRSSSETLGKISEGLYQRSENDLNSFYDLLEGKSAPGERIPRSEDPNYAYAFVPQRVITNLIAGPFALAAGIEGIMSGTPGEAGPASGALAKGFVEQSNPFAPNLTGPQRFEYSLNALFLVIGGLHGAQLSSKGGAVKAGIALRKAGYTPEQAAAIISNIDEGMKAAGKETKFELFKGHADSIEFMREAKKWVRDPEGMLARIKGTPFDKEAFTASLMQEDGEGIGPGGIDVTAIPDEFGLVDPYGGKHSVFDTLPEEIAANSGVNIFEAFRNAMTAQNFRNAAGGTIDIAKKSGDASFGWRSPLSIVDAFGRSLIRGLYETKGGAKGLEVSNLFRGAEREMTQRVHQWQTKVDGIVELVDQAFTEQTGKGVNIFTKGKRTRFDEEFVNLVEKPFNDLERIKESRSDTARGRALKAHDALTEEIRQFVIQSRRDLGIDTPDDWGITDRGYFRHMFLGDLKVIADGQTVGRARTYMEAQKIAQDHLNKNPKSQITVEARQAPPPDSTLRVSNRRYWQAAGNLADTVKIPIHEVLEDMRGIVGRQGAKQKFSPYALHRTGAGGYSMNYIEVMKFHAAQVARSQVLSELNRAVTPHIEDIAAGRGTKTGKPMPGLADMMKQHLSDIWGTPSKFEQNVGRMIENTPVLRDHVAVPSFAMRHVARIATTIQQFTKLRFNVKSTLINAIQPIQTLWPEFSTKELALAVADSLKPQIRQQLKDRGVLAGATKLEQPGILGRTSRKIDPFSAASQQNRAVGYLAGYRQAIAKGLDEAQAHTNGLAWAEFAEFDNSVWNAPEWLRSPQGRILGQYKGFTVKNLERIVQTINDPNTPATAKGLKIAKIVTGQVLIGGVKSIAPMALGTLVAKLYVALKGEGATDQEAANWVDAVVFGAPALLGADLSSSMSLIDVYGNSNWEKFGKTVAGPTGSNVIEAFQAGSDLINAQDGEQKTAGEKRQTILNRAARQMTPYARQVQNIADPKLSTGQEPTEAEKLMLWLGFTPVRASKSYLKKDAKKNF